MMVSEDKHRAITGPQNSHAMTVFLRHGEGGTSVDEDSTDVLWSDVPFPIFECDQKIGDLVIFPPRSYRQVLSPRVQDSSVLFLKWTTSTVSSLVDAFHEELPVSRR